MSERISADELQAIEALPDPRQLHSLMDVVIKTAREQNLLRQGRGRNSDKARFITVKPIDNVSLNDAAELTNFEEQLRGHIRRYPITAESPRRHWRLLLVQVYGAKHLTEATVRRVTSRYSFEWDDTRTVRASRFVTTQPVPDKLGIDDLILQQGSNLDEEIAIQGSEMEMSVVSSLDCDQLREEVVEFCRRSRLIGVHPNEKRAW